MFVSTTFPESSDEIKSLEVEPVTSWLQVLGPNQYINATVS